MRTLLIIAGILLVLAVNFVLYCCIRVGANEDRLLENHRKEQIGADYGGAEKTGTSLQMVHHR